MGDTSQFSCSTACRPNLANTWRSSYLHDILHNGGPAGHLVLLLWPLLHFQPVLWGLHLLLHEGNVIMMSWGGGVLLMTDVLQLVYLTDTHMSVNRCSALHLEYVTK